MNFISGIVFCIPIAVSGLSLDAVLSAYSGLVADVEVGRPRERIRMCIDFEGHETTFFTGDACPPFVNCYDPSRSGTFERVKTYRYNDYETQAYEVVHGMRTPIRFGGRSERNSARGSECAGTIGLRYYFNDWHESRCLDISRGGYLMGSSPVKIRPCEAKWRPEPDLRVHASGSWKFPGRLTAAGLDFGDTIRLDLTESDVLIPLRFRAELEPALAAIGSRVADDESERILVPCDATGRPTVDLGMEFRVGENDSEPPIRLITDALVFSDAVVEDGLCPCRIRFSDTSTVVLGQPVLDVTERIMLDFYSGNVLRIRRSTYGAMRTKRPIPLIPIFTGPEFINGHQVTIRLNYTQEVSTGLVLLDRNEVKMRDRSKAWRFARIGPAIHEPTVAFDGPFSSIHMRSTVGGLEFTAHPSIPHSERLRVQTLFLGDQLFVSVKELPPPGPPRIASLDVPPVEIVPSTIGDSDATECGVCLEAIAAGHRKQRLRHCQHAFHQACVAQWFETGYSSCPMCRAPVGPRTTSQPTTTTAAPRTTTATPTTRSDCDDDEDLGLACVVS